jgi:hypothetical protein
MDGLLVDTEPPADHGWHVVESLTDLDVARLTSLLGGDGRQDVEVGGTAGREDRSEHSHDG